MAIHKWEDVKKARLTPAQLEASKKRVSAELAEMQLKELRRMAGKSQVEVAEALQMVQSALSRTEQRGDHRTSTLRKYIEALGGKLELVARFGNKSYKLRDA